MQHTIPRDYYKPKLEYSLIEPYDNTEQEGTESALSSFISFNERKCSPADDKDVLATQSPCKSKYNALLTLHG